MQHEGPGVAVFTDIGYANQGDMGSKVLKKGPSQETWKAGSSVEVAWGIRYNREHCCLFLNSEAHAFTSFSEFARKRAHPLTVLFVAARADGGGYQYRLCPANEPLTEKCFQKMPLDFDRTKQQLLWNNGTRLSIPGVFLDKGTNPIGSTWARNPIPRIDWGSGDTQPAFGGSCISPRGHRTANCVNFKPPCEEGLWDNGKDGMLPWRKIDATAPADDVQGYCSGDWTGGQIVDEVVIPANLPKGEYVVGWRWDWCVIGPALLVWCLLRLVLPVLRAQRGDDANLDVVWRRHDRLKTPRFGCCAGVRIRVHIHVNAALELV